LEERIMKISRISVKNLFGMFDHDINLHSDDRITIIHGLNGVGKTTILSLVDGVINRQHLELQNIPFNEFRIDFDNRSYISLHKEIRANFLQDDLSDKDQLIEFIWHKPGKKNRSWKSSLKFDPRELPFPPSIVERFIPELRRVGSVHWKYIPTDEVITLEKVVSRFGNRLPIQPKLLKMGWPEWIDECLNETQVRYVRAQRLLILQDEMDDQRYREGVRYSLDEERRSRVSEAVLSYSSQLRNIIKNKLAESSLLAASLDRTFPLRMIESYERTDIMSQEELHLRLKSYEQKRNYLISVGLYDPDKEVIKIPEVYDQHIRRVLSVYVQDVEKKVGIFDELADKINLLVELINSRFKFKKMEIDKEKGFIFRTDGRVLSPANLSSGEQHELVLTYELLFQTNKDTLVMIDEPELSLHVGWQIRFLDDLQQIINLAEIDALVATHSPQIINNRWDLTEQLGSIEE
jgi:predicted ATP-binding protein involved in virulence